MCMMNFLERNLKELATLFVVFLCMCSMPAFSDNSYLNTGLPVCYIDYDASVEITKENKIDAKFVLCAPDETVRGEVKLWGRGNYTWILAKKPYNLKFDKKISLLGMPSGKKYALMANACDPSMCRIAVGFEAGRWVDFEWPLQGRYVELVLNGSHQGTYFLAERVSQSTVKVDKTNGYILEYKYANQITDESVNFTTNLYDMIFEFKDPDQPQKNGEMYNDAVRRVNDFEEAIFADDNMTARRWEKMVDMDNFVRWYYWKNLLQMDECNRYYVEENYLEDKPLKMGPLWDFDWTIGMDFQGNHYDSQNMRNKLFFAPLAKDKVFQSRVARFHFDHRQQIETEVKQLYDSLSTLLRTSVQQNELIWGQYRTSPLDWEKEVATDKAYLLATLRFLDNELGAYLEDSGIRDLNEQSLLPRCSKYIDGTRLYLRRGSDVYDARGLKMKLKN